MIVIAHLAQTYSEMHSNLLIDARYFNSLKYATLNTNIIIMQILRCLGMIGNDIFWICTVWFLVEKKK